ncbi:MAG: menaquinone biosynthesis decarboxylase [Verrucomicrobia bacterium]|nr:menaquinone biosynthesis decarboxylase [Verrucomicrobiota bacterium]
MPYNSLRDFTNKLEAEGELRRVEAEISPALEITEYTDRVCKAGGPALLFTNVRGSKFPVLMNAFGSMRRMALALGVSDVEDIAREIEALLHKQPPATLMDKVRTLVDLFHLSRTAPRTVRTGPCKQIVEHEPDLSKLPVLTCWPQDGGPFITLPTVFSKHPETGQRNVGMYRMQVYDARTTGMHWHVHKVGAAHYRAYEARGERMPVAVALGGDPAMTYAATAPLPEAVDEVFFAGFLRKKGIDMVKCETCDLEVPADADFVLEGYVDPGERRREGPFGDHTGYYSLDDDYPVFHLKCITRRADPIYAATVVGRPPMEDCFMAKTTERLFLPMLKAVLPELVDMNLPLEGVFHNLALVSIRKQYPFHARKVMHALWGLGQMMFTKTIVVVDEEVNVQDPSEVAWRTLANIDPKRDITFAEGPTDVLDHAAQHPTLSSKLGIDATRKWPTEGFSRQWPDPIKMTPEVKRRIDELLGGL